MLSSRHCYKKIANIRIFSYCLGLWTIVALQACSTNIRSIDSQLGANAEVRIQVCLPNKKVNFDELVIDKLENHPLFTKYSSEQIELAPKTIRRVVTSGDPKAIRVYWIGFGEVLIRDGQFSDSTGVMPLQDSTVADQPVYESGYGYPVRDYVAMHVRIPDAEKEAEDRVTYWFVLQKNIPNDKFSEWIMPISMEPEGQRQPMLWKLTHGGNLEINAVPSESPKMRFSLMERQTTKHDDPKIDTLPALTTARMKFKTTTSSQQFVYEFVPKANESIPACN